MLRVAGLKTVLDPPTVTLKVAPHAGAARAARITSSRTSDAVLRWDMKRLLQKKSRAVWRGQDLFVTSVRRRRVFAHPDRALHVAAILVRRAGIVVGGVRVGELALEGHAGRREEEAAVELAAALRHRVGGE